MLAMIKNLTLGGALFVMCVDLSGCSRPAGDAAPAATEQASESGRSHDGWWCSEHGLPEAQCALCDVKLVGEFRAQGDWCAEHNRPDSQCFVCHPEKEAEFAALYEAKYGEAPPPVGTPHDEGQEHDHPDS